jgi:hypothetical protein
VSVRYPRGPAPARSRAPAANVTRVTSPSTTVVTVEIDLDGDPISGWLVDEDGVAHRFTGWLGLTQVLTATLHAARQADAVPATVPPTTPRSSR